ncbi:MAG: ATPase, partial [Euryarchaeota archaeon]|nr:ATPase [Euryarchaeota archaeon]
MPRGPIGVIFGETGSLGFKFAIANGQVVRRTGYVKVWHESDDWVLAQVTSVTRSSDVYSLDTAISAADGMRVKSADEKVVAKANVIGARDAQGMLRTPKTPFSPGDRVYEADRELMQSTLGLAHEGI